MIRAYRGLGHAVEMPFTNGTAVLPLSPTTPLGIILHLTRRRLVCFDGWLAAAVSKLGRRLLELQLIRRMLVRLGGSVSTGRTLLWILVSILAVSQVSLKKKEQNFINLNFFCQVLTWAKNTFFTCKSQDKKQRG